MTDELEALIKAMDRCEQRKVGIHYGDGALYGLALAVKAFLAALDTSGLRALMENPPPTDIVRSRKWQPRQIGDVYADWIDAVVAAWERSER